MNMHCSIHVVHDVITTGCNLSEITAFPFEIFLGKLIGLIRTPNHPLAQICRRLHELKKIDPPKPTLPFRIQLLKYSEAKIF